MRGLVGSQLDERVARAFGTAFARCVATPAAGGPPRPVVVGHDMRESSPGLVRAFAEGVAGEGVDVELIGLTSTDGLYYASGALDAPAVMFTASHNPAGWNGMKLCRAGARPIGLDSGLAEIRDVAEQVLAAPAPAAAPSGSDQRAGHPARLRRAPARPGGPDRDPAAAGRGRRRQRDGRADRPRGARHGSRAAGAAAGHRRRCTSSWTAPSRTTRPTRWTRRTCVTCRPRCRRTAPTSGWRSTATPTAASSSTSGASRSARARSPRWSPAGEIAKERAAGRRGHRDPQPDHLPGRAGGGRASTARTPVPHPGRPRVHQGGDGRTETPCSAASTPRTTTSATSGSPTPACSPRCTCWPRSASQDAAAVASWSRAYERYAASGEINSTVDDVAAATARVERAFAGRPGSSSTGWTG